MKKLLAFVVALLSFAAIAQQSNPGLVYGQVPTASQWNSYFSSKLDYNASGLALNLGGTGSTTAAGARANLGVATGSGGHAIPYLDGVNTWSGAQTFSAGVAGNISGGTFSTLTSGGIPLVSGSKALVAPSSGNPFGLSISAAPSSLCSTNSIGTAFNCDLSHVTLPIKHSITGVATLGQPASGYLYTDNAYPVYGYLYNSSGWNQSTSGNDGRTAAAFSRVHVYQAGQGDAVAYNATAFTGSACAVGATSFLACPAASLFNGDMSAGFDSTYLNPYETIINDAGHGVAAVGHVNNLVRTSSARPLGDEWWAGYRTQSQGSVAPDVAYSASGPFNIGLDFSFITLPTSGTGTSPFNCVSCAITLKADQRIYGNATATDPAGLGRFPSSAGNAYFTYSSSLGAWNFIAANASVLQLSGSQVVANTIFKAGTNLANYLEMDGASTGNVPGVFAKGSDANVSYGIRTQAGGNFFAYSDGGSNVMFGAERVASSVNYIAAVPAITGAIPGAYSRGTDTDIGYGVRTKGSGPFVAYSDGGSNVMFGAERVASSVNYPALLPSATGSAVQLVARGTDTDRSINIVSAGAGTVQANGVRVVDLSSSQTITNKTLTSPVMTTPSLGLATATSINKVAITAPATSATLTVADGKTLTASNTITLAATDGSTLNIGAGGTLAASATTDTTNASNIGSGTLAAGRLPAALSSSTSINGLGITASTGTLTVANGKTLTANNSVTVAGTDGTTFTTPTQSASAVPYLGSATWASTQACNGTYSGYKAFVTDLGANGTEVYCNGTRWRPVNGSAVLSVGTGLGSFTNSEVIGLQTKIPAAFLQTGDIIRTYFSMTKSGSTDNGNITFRLGTAGTTADTALTGGNANAQLGAANLTGGFIWDFQVVGATSIQKIGVGNGGSGSYTGAANAAITAATTISNLSNALWFNVDATSSSTNNTVSLPNVRIELLTP